MKCRDMNPGNFFSDEHNGFFGEPSMKCRDMNPGNLHFLPPPRHPGDGPLNEVPGYESRQYAVSFATTADCFVPQ